MVKKNRGFKVLTLRSLVKSSLAVYPDCIIDFKNLKIQFLKRCTIFLPLYIDEG